MSRSLRSHSETVLTLVSALLLAVCLTLTLDTFSDAPSIERDSGWIRDPRGDSYISCFRLSIALSGEADQAWLRVSAKEAFELAVNGNTVARSFLWRPSRPFQNGLSESGQRAQPFTPLLFLNFPREHQWGDCSWWQIPTYVDVRPFLHPGVNIITMEVESRSAPAAQSVIGQIRSRAGEIVSVGPHSAWTVSNVQEFGRDDWTKVSAPHDGWVLATPMPSPYVSRVSLVPTGVFTSPWTAHWLTLPEWRSGETLTLRTIWKTPSVPREAWLRIATNQNYDLLINGKPVRPPGSSRSTLDGSLWTIGTAAAADPFLIPELLDPDETDHLYPGAQYLSPSHSDPTVNDLHRAEDDSNRTHDRPDASRAKVMDQEVADPDLAVNGTSTFTPIHQPSPLSLDKPGTRLAYDGYGVSRLLRAGDNVIEVRMRGRPDLPEKPFFPRLALDGLATFADETTAALPASWSVDEGGPACVTEGADRAVPLAIPLRYQGECRAEWPKVAIGAGAFLVAVALAWVWRRWTNEDDNGTRGRRAALVSGSLVLGATLLLRLALSERSEALLFLFPEFWCGSLAIAAAAATVAWVTTCFRCAPVVIAVGLARGKRRWLSRRFTVALVLTALLVLTGALRWYKADLQPIDDDEYASFEAILAIAHGGTPAYSDAVWYTRSPFYHYLAAGYGICFGLDMLTLRGLSAWLAMLTAGLIYLFGARILRSSTAGLIAAFLFAVHPFAIFSGHIARFYQIQQLCALATLYFLVRGFVQPGGRPWQRMLCVFCLLATILSQELSLVMIPLAGVAVALWSVPLSRREWINLGIVSTGCLGLIVLDLVVFKVRCLTRVVGISPNVEATLLPHFSSPVNYFSLFFGYSRLDFAGTLVLAGAIATGVWRWTRTRSIVASLLGGGIVAVNLLVYGESLRYQFWLLPILLCLVAVAIGEWGRCLASFLQQPWSRRPIMAVLVAVVFLAFSPWRIATSYEAKILGDSASAFGFVRANMRHGDKVAATEPHPHAAKLETGRCDYDLAFPLLHDFTYLKGGKLLDRNASAQVIDTVDGLQYALANNDRVWIVVNREKMRSRGRNLRWEYPGARAEELLRANCTIAYRSYLWTVYLWDADEGRARVFRTGPSL